MPKTASNTEVVATVVLTTLIVTLAFLGMVTLLGWIFN